MSGSVASNAVLLTGESSEKDGYSFGSVFVLGWRIQCIKEMSLRFGRVNHPIVRK
jgi:hypothetical protein